MISVFISHSSKDVQIVSRLSNDLTNFGLKPWISEGRLEIGAQILDTLSKAIAESRFVIVVLSKLSVESLWVQKELSMAMHKEVEENRTVVLPIRIDSCKIPSIIMDKLYFDIRNDVDYSIGLKKLLRAMRVEKAPSRRLVFSESEMDTIKGFEKYFDMIGSDDRLFEYKTECQKLASFILSVSSQFPGKFDSYFEDLLHASSGIPSYKATLVKSAAERALGMSKYET